MKDTSILGVKTWRQQKGITLQTIAAFTKLSVRHLEAIEAGDFKRLPGGIYNTNYIRQYARAIEFDEANLLAFYRDACESGTAPPVRDSSLLFQH
jgi:cytoskeletal protein RodZ